MGGAGGFRPGGCEDVRRAAVGLSRAGVRVGGGAGSVIEEGGAGIDPARASQI